MKKFLAAAGLAIILVVCLLAFVNATSVSSNCLTLKPSAFDGGTLVCWRRPSQQFQGIINAEAFRLGYDVQPDGTFKKVAG